MSNNIVFGKSQNVDKLKKNIAANPHLLRARNAVYTGFEKRSEVRSKSLKKCKIIFNDRFSVFDGVIVNQSASGAKLEIPNARYVVNEFLLNTVFSGVERAVSIQWRRNNSIGIKFVDVDTD